LEAANWKVDNTTLQIMWMWFKLKHYTSISVLKSIHYALFHSYLTYSVLNQGRANKTALLSLIRLQETAVRILKYDKTKTTILYSKHEVLNIPNLFKLSIVNFIHTFDNAKLPNYFVNYFRGIVSLHQSMCVIFLKVWNLTHVINLKVLIWKTIQNYPAILPIFLLIFVSYACHFSVNLYLVPPFSLYLLPFQLPIPPHCT